MGRRNSEEGKLHANLFPKPFGAEEVGNVRLIYLNSILAEGRIGLSSRQMEFLRSLPALDGEAYSIAFLHHALWAGDQPAANRDYSDSLRLRAFWQNECVAAPRSCRRSWLVVASDGGFRAPGIVERLSGIVHIVSGWPAFRSDIPVEWIRIGLCADRPHFTRFRLIGGTLYREQQGR